MKPVSSIWLALMFLAASSTAAWAQAPDARWNDWVGCWNLVADGNVARLPPAETAKDPVAGPIRPGSSRSARVCVSPSQGGAELRTMVGDQQVLSQTIIADNVDHPVSDAGCAGTQRARWSEDGRRLFTRAQVTCENQPQRIVTGLALIAPDGEWVDVQAVTIDGTDSVRVRRFRPPIERAQKGVPAAAVRLQTEHIKEATKYVSPRAIEAALIETSSRFPLSSRVLVDLDKAGVDDRVIDLMVALSYPSKFAIRPSGADDRLTPLPPILNGADFVDASYEYPYWLSPYYSNYYYSPYFFSPFGYSYLRYYSGFNGPFAVIVPEGGGGGGESRPPQNGRAVRGFGYTQVDRRDSSAEGGGGGSSIRSEGRRGSASPRGYTDSGGGSSSSSSGGGSSSSSGGGGGSSSGGGGGSSSGGGGGGSSDSGGRTAVPR
jgi:hypothetical protein